MRLSRDHAAGLIVPLILYIVGPITFNILPLLGEGAAHSLGLSNQQVGVMSMAISIGFSASAVFCGVWVRSVPWPRAAAIGLVGMAATNLLAVFLHLYWAFVVLQGMAGFFGGSVLGLAATILSDRYESARIFGIANALQTAFQVAGLLAGPALLRLGGLNGVLVVLAAVSGVTIFFAPRLPTHGRPVVAAGVLTSLFKPATLIGLVGCGAFFVNAGAYWTYIELIGEARGMSTQLIANCVAGGVSAGVLGGVVAGVLGDRFGKIWPLGAAALMTAVAAVVLSISSSVGAFLLSVILYYLAWTYSLAYQLAMINAVDTTGRGVAMTGAFGNLGSAGGAALVAPFVTPGGYGAIGWVVVVAVCLSTILFVLSYTVNRSGAVPVRV